jgi:hypothetical protein
MTASRTWPITIAALSCCLNVTDQSANLPHFRERYSGYIYSVPDGSSQNIYLDIVSERVDPVRGLVIAQGWERYDVGGRCMSVEIEITVAPRIGEFVMLRKPKPSDRTQDTTVVDPQVGVISPDFQHVVNDLGQDENQHYDFVFRAEPVAHVRPEQPHRAAAKNEPSARLPGC